MRVFSIVPAVSTDRLLGDIRALIGAAHERTARAVNSALVGLYWHIGTRIRQDVLQEAEDTQCCFSRSALVNTKAVRRP
jgi:hypothetical protein